MYSTIPGLTPGQVLSPQWRWKWSKDQPIQVNNRRNVPSLLETSKLEMPNVNLYITKKKCYSRLYQANAPTP